MKTFTHLPTEVFSLAENIYYHDIKSCKTIDCELIYWRKWWGIRNEVVRDLTTTSKDQYEWHLTPEDYDMIISHLKYYRNKERWESEGQSVWYYEEDGIEDQIDIDIYVLETLKTLLQAPWYKELIEKGIMEVTFYDSY